MDKYTFTKELQERMVKLILTENSLISSYRSVVDPDYFDNPADGIIVAETIIFYNKYRSVPTKSELLASSTSFTPEIITHLNEIYSRKIGNTKFLVDKMVAFAQYKAMRDAIIESSDIADNVDERFKIRKLISNALKVGIDLRDIGENLVTGYKDRYIQRLKIGLDPDKVSTGIKGLDKVIVGLGPGEEGVIMAAPKGFKSGTLTHLGGAAMSQRLKVVYYTFELAKHRVIERFERKFAGIFRKQLIDEHRKIERVLKRINVIGGGLLVKEYPMKRATVDDLYSHLELVQSEGYKPDMIVVDYGAIMRPMERGEPHQQITGIYANLRGLAQEFCVPLWTAAQVNRKGVSKKIIKMDDVAEAFGIIPVCDVAIAICQTPEERQLNQARLFVAANRNEMGYQTVPIVIDYDRMRIKQWNVRSEE